MVEQGFKKHSLAPGSTFHHMFTTSRIICTSSCFPRCFACQETQNYGFCSVTVANLRKLSLAFLLWLVNFSFFFFSSPLAFGPGFHYSLVLSNYPSNRLWGYNGNHLKTIIGIGRKECISVMNGDCFSPAEPAGHSQCWMDVFRASPEWSPLCSVMWKIQQWTQVGPSVSWVMLTAVIEKAWDRNA